MTKQIITDLHLKSYSAGLLVLWYKLAGWSISVCLLLCLPVNYVHLLRHKDTVTNGHF
jgi:hypothetical protein